MGKKGKKGDAASAGEASSNSPGSPPPAEKKVASKKVGTLKASEVSGKSAAVKETKEVVGKVASPAKPSKSRSSPAKEKTTSHDKMSPNGAKKHRAEEPSSGGCGTCCILLTSLLVLSAAVGIGYVYMYFDNLEDLIDDVQKRISNGFSVVEDDQRDYELYNKQESPDNIEPETDYANDEEWETEGDVESTKTERDTEFDENDDDTEPSRGANKDYIEPVHLEEDDNQDAADEFETEEIVHDVASENIGEESWSSHDEEFQATEENAAPIEIVREESAGDQTLGRGEEMVLPQTVDEVYVHDEPGYEQAIDETPEKVYAEATPEAVQEAPEEIPISAEAEPEVVPEVLVSIEHAAPEVVSIEATIETPEVIHEFVPEVVQPEVVQQEFVQEGVHTVPEVVQEITTPEAPVPEIHSEQVVFSEEQAVHQDDAAPEQHYIHGEVLNVPSEELPIDLSVQHQETFVIHDDEPIQNDGANMGETVGHEEPVRHQVDIPVEEQPATYVETPPVEQPAEYQQENVAPTIENLNADLNEAEKITDQADVTR